MDGLKPGRIVYYVLTAQDAEAINRRRTTGSSIAERIQQEAWPLGAQAHIGEPVAAGEIWPSIVVRIWSHRAGTNLKVFLDGSDEYWVVGVPFDLEKTPGTWHWMFEGQATRYQPDPVEKTEATS